MSKSLLEEVRRRVLSPGPFAGWRHESANQARPVLTNLRGTAETVLAHCQDLVGAVAMDNYPDTRRVAFAVLQNIYPIVEALDTDAGLYLAQATEALRKKQADV